MNIRDLKYFLAVADLEHFGKAAEKCFVSQPTLSGQIKKLEDELGVKLFERTNRKVLLTDIGTNIAEITRKILTDVGSLYEIAAAEENPLSGKFRLGAFPTLSTYIFPDLVKKIKDKLPNLKLILAEEKTAILLQKLKKGEIDAALLALPIYDDFLVSHKLFDDEFMLAVPKDHNLSAHKEIDQRILEDYPILLLEEGHCLRDQALDVCQLNGYSEEQDFRATGLETLRLMVKAGTGITFFPKIAINKDKDIKFIPFKAPAPQRTIGLVWRKTSPRTKVIEKLIDFLS